ncbi:MAG TPA: MFS transporter [Anaerolineales bacterium]|nr:MFS transporter [Anaerolineales bacterium]
MTEKPSSRPTVLPYAWVILTVIYLASVVAPFNQFKVPPIMPVLMETFHITLTQAGSLMSILALVGLILALPAGIILRKLGTKVSGLIALACTGAGAVVGALSGSYEMLMVSRVLEGVGMGLIGVIAPATIAMWFPPERQGTPMGIWATWVPVGSVVMFNLAPALAGSAGWQSVWWVGAGFALVMMLAHGALIRQPPSAETGDTASESLELGKALANRDIWLLALAFACMSIAMLSVNTFYPTYLNETLGYSLGRAGFVSSIGTFVILFSAPLAGWFSDRIGSRRWVFSLPFLAIAVLLLFPFHVTGVWIPILMGLMGFITGAIPTATFAAAPEVMRKPQWAGLGLAVILLGQNAGQLLGPILFGQFVNAWGWAAAGYAMIPVCLIGFVSAWMVRVR